MNPRAEALVFIKNFLGYDAPACSVITSVIITILLFFYIFSLSSFINPTVWVLIDRVSYYSPFEAYVVNNSIDNQIIGLSTAAWLGLSLRFIPIIRLAVSAVYVVATIICSILGQSTLEILAIISVPLIVSLIILNRIKEKKILIFENSQVMNYFILIGIALGIIAFLISLEPSLNHFYVIPMNNLAHQIFLIFSSLSPVLLILLILCFPVKIISDAIVTKFKISNTTSNDVSLHQNRFKPILKLMLLLLFVGISAVMTVIPHQQIINFDNKDVGVDTHYYVEWTNTLLNSNSTNQILREIFVVIQHGDRPLSLLFFLGIANIVPDANLSYVFDYVPIILGPVLVIVVYVLTRELTSSELAALLSAFVTAISFHNLVGIYAGSYANWLALIAGYLAMLFMFRSLKGGNKWDLCWFAVLTVTLLFTHIYTWTILSMVMGIFLLVMIKLNHYDRKYVIILLIILASTVLLDVVRMAITGSYSGIGYEISPPFGSDLRLGRDQFVTRWSNLIDTTQNYYGSLFGNSMIYGLGLYWLFRTRLRQADTAFLIVFLSIGILPLFLGNWPVQARVFYDIPFQIPAGIALAFIYTKYAKPKGVLVLLSICIWLVAMSIQAVSNFHPFPS